MLNCFRENINKYILERFTQAVWSYVILVVSVVIVLYVVMVMSGNVIYAPDQLLYNISNEKVGYTDSGLQGIFSYGPYINLRKGTYKISIYYETNTETTFDICYKNEKGTLLEMQKGVLEHDKSSKTIIICNDRDIDNASFEIRTYYQGMGYLQVNSISVRQCFCFDRFVIITLATILLSLLFVCGRKLINIWQRPREVLCFGCFYTVISCLCLYSMTFLVGLEKLWMYSILNGLIVFHAYGCRKEWYDNDIVAGNILSTVCYAFLFYTLWQLDRSMQGIISQDARSVYADNTPYLFSCSIIACIVFIAAIIKKLWMRRIFYGIVYYLFVVLLAVQYIYYQVFNKLFSFKDMQLAGESSNYAKYVLSLFNGDFGSALLPLIVIGAIGLYLLKYTVMISVKLKILVGSIVVLVILYSHTIYTKDYGEWNSFENDNFIYETMNDKVRAFKLCGYFQYELRDLKKTILREATKDKEHIAELDSFFSARKDEGIYNTNLMTGIFEGKNVIFILMESVDDIACREDVMPTLYKMSREGINFSNMYAPIYGSAATMNSEAVTNIGYYAPLDGSMVYSFSDNYFPYSLAVRFRDKGYVARQYHFNVPDFYDRGIMSSAFGYEEYVSFIENTEGGTSAELDTILVEEDKLYYALIQDKKFFDYIISYTAHLPYDKTNSLVQAALERHPEYEDMTYSEEINNYFAKARITDDMLSGLIQRLEDDGLLDNTVIIAIGDHYPYGISDKDALYDFSGVEKYEQLLYRVPCVVWTPEIESMEIDKVASSIDLVPTIVNLMGLGDCSVYIGCDIFNEDYEGFAYFSDGSWISGDGYYYQGHLVYGTLDEIGINDLNVKVMENIRVNDSVLHLDYWYKHKGIEESYHTRLE